MLLVFTCSQNNGVELMASVQLMTKTTHCSICRLQLSIRYWIILASSHIYSQFILMTQLFQYTLNVPH